MMDITQHHGCVHLGVAVIKTNRVITYFTIYPFYSGHIIATTTFNVHAIYSSKSAFTVFRCNQHTHIDQGLKVIYVLFVHGRRKGFYKIGIENSICHCTFLTAI